MQSASDIGMSQNHNMMAHVLADYLEEEVFVDSGALESDSCPRADDLHAHIIFQHE